MATLVDYRLEGGIATRLRQRAPALGVLREAMRVDTMDSAARAGKS